MAKGANNSKNTASKNGARASGYSSARNNGAGAKKQMTRREMELMRERKAKSLRTVLVCFAVLALVSVIAIAVGIPVSNYLSTKRVDYLNDNLGKYITLSREDYSSFDVVLNLDEVTEDAVDNAILQLLCANKKSTPLHSGLRFPTIGAGDVSYIRYRGYTLDEAGNKIDFNGGCNYSDNADAELEIGSGSFIQGFELGMVDKNPLEHGTLTTLNSGEVKDGDILYISYTVFSPVSGEDAQGKYAYVDLSSNAPSELFGEDFKEYFLTVKDEEGNASARKIGETYKDTHLVSNYKGTGGTASYTDLKIVKAFRPEGTPLTVEAYFPLSYGEPTLAGKNVYFDVYIMGADDYDAPEYNDAFVTETLGITAEDLADYEGETLADKYRSCVRESLELDRETEIEYAVQDAMWSHYIEKVKIKKLPRGEVNAYYNKYLRDLQSGFDSSGSLSYESFDQYAYAYLGIEDPSTTWQDVLTAQAENTVLEKLVLFYVIDKEGLKPSEAEYNELYANTVNSYLQSYLTQAGCTRDKYSTEQEYLAAVERYKTSMLASYDAEYFPESVYFEYAFRSIREFANIK